MKLFCLIVGMYLVIAAAGKGAGWIGLGIFLFGFMAGYAAEGDGHG